MTFNIFLSKVGDVIPSLTLPKLSRATLALFAGASGDHNQIHIDIDYAKKAGMDDVFGQGMLTMAYLSRLLTDIVPPENIKNFGVRFSSITQIYANLTCEGEVIRIYEDGGEKLIRLKLTVKDENDDVKIMGYAVVAA